MKTWLLYIIAFTTLGACSTVIDKKPQQENKQEHRQHEIDRRIALDFDKTKAQVKEELNNYIGDISDQQWEKWEKQNVLEYKISKGKKRYFHNAAANVFRIDSAAHALQIQKGGKTPSPSDQLITNCIPTILNALKDKKTFFASPQRIQITYTLTVKADAVAAGDTLRCWLPYPRRDVPRQTNVKLISTSESRYILSPDSIKHSSIYMEKKVEKGKSTQFKVSYAYISQAEWHAIDPDKILPYDKNSSLYRIYTAERKEHICFLPQIKALTDSIVGKETNPYLQARKLFSWIDQHFPWASAREYSTIPNIPLYVLNNHHGDCGQVTLLFCTMARYKGIPTHFQSGFIIQPTYWNLHDWGEIYFEGIGWIPIDQSMGIQRQLDKPNERFFMLGGVDPYRLVINNDFGKSFYPAKKYIRSETVDFQRGEIESNKKNLYFDQWTYDLKQKVTPLSVKNSL